MLRWMILLSTCLIWLLCMGLVYVQCRPRESKEAQAGMRAGQEALFAEDAELKRVWRIYVDLRAQNGSGPVEPWNGFDESALTDVGYLEITLKRGDKEASRVEQITEAELLAPPEARVPPLSDLGVIRYYSRADISQDSGLEGFNSRFSTRFGWEALALGVREGDELKITQQVFEGRNKLLETHEQITIGSKGMPSLELMPFQPNREVKVGYTWDISAIDTSLLEAASNSKPKIVSLKVACTGKRQIKHEGQRVTAFEVRSGDGKARAWYSAEGTVLKQAYRLFDALDVAVVRANVKTFKRRLWQPGRQPGNGPGRGGAQDHHD